MPDLPLPDTRRIKPQVVKALVAEGVKKAGTVNIDKVTDNAIGKRQLPDLALLQGVSESTHVTPPEPLSAAKMKSSRLAHQVAKSLSIANPVTETGMALSAGMPILGAMNNGMLILRVVDLEFYDRNPRRDQNPRFEEIKSSIRESGAATIIFEVTKRPDAKKYMVARGGNTRLRALKELWSETYDSKYEQVTCIFKAWNGDLKTMAAHWLENNLRGDMSFIDQATEIAEMRSEIEVEKGEALSHRAFSEELKRLGVVISKSNMSYLLFTAEHISIMGDMAKYVNQNSVKRLQPICNKVASLGESGEFGVGMREYSVYEEIIDPVFKIWAEQFVISEQEQTELPDVDDFEKLLVKQVAKTQQMEVAKVKALLYPEKQKSVTQAVHSVNENNVNENDSTVHSVDTARIILNNDYGNQETTLHKTGVSDVNENDFTVHSVDTARTILNNSDDIRESARAQLRSLPEKTSADHSLQPYDESEDAVNENDSTVRSVDTARTILNNSDQVSVDASILSCVEAIATLYSLQNYIVIDESLPLGYLIDIPMGLTLSDEFTDNSDLRCAFWFLATVSQQITIPLHNLPTCPWRSLREHGQDQFELFCCAELGASSFEDGKLLLSMPDMLAWMMQHHALVSSLLSGGTK